MNAKKPVKAYKHKGKRAHIPSGEEAGYEAGSVAVAQGPDQVLLPLNPVVTRGQDPELFWMHKYPTDERLSALLAEMESALKSGDTTTARSLLEQARETIQHRYDTPADAALPVDIRSLYRHEHISPETIVSNLWRYAREEPAPAATEEPAVPTQLELFGNAIGHEEIDKVSDYYTHSDGWTNRLIQGDSLLVMTSLVEREGMAGQVQCIYIDPPYGIKYGSNWQIRLNNRTVKDGDDASVSGEPEQVKAFRDTWELGIHSYLSYLRERLLVARELLHESGSCFIQISDENIHLVRNVADEVFGSGNFCSVITLKKTTGVDTTLLPTMADFILWYAKDRSRTKFRPLFTKKSGDDGGAERYDQVELDNGLRRPMTQAEKSNLSLLPKSAKRFQLDNLVSSEFRPDTTVSFQFEGRTFHPGNSNHWKTTINGLLRLGEKQRLQPTTGGTLRYVRFLDDFPASPVGNVWTDISGSIQSRSDPKVYVVQTSTAAIARCILMTTDPGDLVLDPTCGSGTTAYVAEQWGRRWITIDTSRIALNIAKTRLLTAKFPFYELHDQEHCDLRQGFKYKKVPHITLGSIANNEPPTEETLYDQPAEDKTRLRVTGPFTVETLQSYEPVSPEDLAKLRSSDTELANFEDLIFEHLRSAGVKTGDKRENAVFTRIDRLSHSSLHAEGWYPAGDGEKKAYLHIGPKFGTVSKQSVSDAIKACRDRRDGDWLLILGFAFESGLHDLHKDFGSFQVSLVRMHDDLMQQGLLKKDKKAASFVTIGEPDIRLHRTGGAATVEIAGLDIYDPIKDEVKSRDVHDIAYWMLDDAYDGSNFVVRQIFFCGGDKDEFSDWKKGLNKMAEQRAKSKVEHTLKIEIDDQAFTQLYGHISRQFVVMTGQKVAVRVVSQFGEETTKVLVVG